MSNTTFPVKPLVIAMALASSQAYGVCQTEYTVTNATNDLNNVSTLQGAFFSISSSCSNIDVTVTIDDALANEVIDHGEYQYSIYGDTRVTLIGPSENRVTVKHTGASENIFVVGEGGHLNIQNLILDGGQQTGSAPAINVASSSQLSLDNVLAKEFYGGSSGGSIVYSKGDVEISNSVFNGNTSQGSGGAIYLGNDSGNLSTQINITNSVLQNNTAQGDGGALYINGSTANATITTTLEQSTFDSNDSYKHGGAIIVKADTAVALNIQQSTLSNNTSDTGNSSYGNGGAFYGLGINLDLQIENSTLTGNNADHGGAIYFADSLVMGSSIKHSTIVGNTANNTGAIEGESSPNLDITHSIVANNTGAGRDICFNNESSVGANIFYSILDDYDAEDTSCKTDTVDASNQVSLGTIDLKLGELADNGGLTQTLYPQLTSPVINAGNAAITDEPDTDQTGAARISRGRIDIGAVEYINQIPTGSGIDNISINTNQVIEVNIFDSFADVEDSLTFATGDLPDGFSLSGAGVLTGSSNIPSSQSVTITADDGFDQIQEIFTFSVLNQAPTAGSFENQTINTLDYFEFDASDAFSDPEGGSLVYSITGLPSGFSAVENTPVFTGTSIVPSSGMVTVIAEDENGATAQASFTLSVLNQAPSAGNLVDQTINASDEDFIFDTSTAFSDPEGGSFAYSVTGLPTGFNINTYTGEISGDSQQASSGLVTVTAEDEHGATAQASFTLTVVNHAPIFDGLTDLTIQAGRAVLVDLGQVDDAERDDISIITSNLPQWLTLNPSTFLLTGTATKSVYEGSPYTITVTASDGYNSISQDVTLTITNDAPIFSVIENIELLVGDDVNIDLAQASDEDGGDNNIHYAVTGLPEGFTVEAGVVTGTVTQGMLANSPYNIRIAADDGFDITSAEVSLNITEKASSNDGLGGMATWFLSGLALLGLARRKKYRV